MIVPILVQGHRLTIGECSLVAAGSIVTKSVPYHMVVGENPAKVICTVNEYIIRNINLM
jgi:acetyltransferase-like isoleucine patch superfamily enzyme